MRTLRHASHVLSTALLLSLAGCVAPGQQGNFTAPSGPDPVIGTLPGGGDFISGAAVYHIDLSIPPGREKVHPNLTLRYSSMSGNSPLGVGWFMDMQDEIVCCLHLTVPDGYNN